MKEHTAGMTGAEHGRHEQELDTYGATVCRQCGAELPALAECYPTECAQCGGRRFYAIRPAPKRRPKPDKAAFLPDVGVIDDYTL